eukprot:GEMP01058784.1.p1 GENE.GEMP01058784.1~~GEMP01058784.1.p1  ORF type:complete len:219 (+),score=49.34 GEMP01058784.1:99-659(+)
MLLREWKELYASMRKRDRKSMSDKPEMSTRKKREFEALDDFVKKVFLETQALVNERSRIRDEQILDREAKIKEIARDVAKLKAENEVLRAKKLQKVAADSAQVDREKREFEVACEASRKPRLRSTDDDTTMCELIQEWNSVTKETATLSQECMKDLERMLRGKNELTKLREGLPTPAVLSYIEEPL